MWKRRYHHHHGRCDFWDCCDSCECCEPCDGCECCDRSTLRIVAWVVGVFLLLVLLAIFISWLVLRPTKPRFELMDATVHQLNISLANNTLSAVIQATVSSHNPNGRVGVYYDGVDVYAAYQDQRITLSSPVPPFYQGHHDDEVWSPYLYGADVPVGPYLRGSVQQDAAAGYLMLHIKIDCRIRWRVGTWSSGRYHLDVTCPALFSFRNASGGEQQFDAFQLAALQLQQMSPCSASV